MEKIQEIKGIKRFYDIRDINFESSKIIIFFGENGSGKTTLSKLLKTLHDRDIERVSSLKHDEGRFIKTNLIFNDGSCVDCIINDNAKRINGEFPTALEVFNIDFINNYIYLGHEVTANQKSNLYKFVFGEHQVQLQQQIDEKIEEIKKLNTQIKDKETELIKLAQISKEEIEDFVGMNVQETIQDLENHIAELNTKLKNLRENEYINKLGTLKPINLKEAEDLVSKVKNVCETSLGRLYMTALKRFEEHIQIIGEDKREWLKDGFQIVKSKNLDICPFCGKDIKANELVKEYETAFNEEYINFIQHLDRLAKQINEFSLSYMVELINQNDELIQKWSKYINDLEVPQLGDIREIEKEIKQAFMNLLEQKRQNVFVSLDNFSEIDSLIEKIIKQIGFYNKKVEEINKRIEEFKQDLSKESAREAHNQIRELKRKLKRKQLDSLCQEYIELSSKKEELEQEKKELIDQLNEEMNEFLNMYEETINHIFEKFNTDYRIKSQKISATRKRQTFEYGIQLNFSEDIKPNQKLGEILSEGDKTTLAFSVFIAKLLLDDKLNEKIVIIDDPISSLDDFRINRTVDYVMRILDKAKQMIVLSHNPLFLKELLYRVKKEKLSSSCCFFKIQKHRKFSQMERFNYNQAEYFIEQKLTPYYEYFNGIIGVVNRWEKYEQISGEEIDDAFESGRIVFEHYLRLKFPEDILTPTGEIINKINDSEKKRFLNELYNALTKDHHSNTTRLSKEEKISYMKDLINLVRYDRYS